MEKTCIKLSPAPCAPSVAFGEVPMTELTLALIKPDAIQSGDLEKFMLAMDKHGFVVVTSTHTQLTRVRAEEFYEDLEGSDSFEKFTRFLSSGSIHAFVLGKKNAIQEWNVLIGPADPEIARRESPLSLRALYGTNAIRNAVHGSSSHREAKREISFFFPTGGLQDIHQWDLIDLQIIQTPLVFKRYLFDLVL